MATDLVQSETRADGAMAGVFEFDGDTGYFYLYDTAARAGHKVMGAIHVITGVPDFAEADVRVRWDDTGAKVGLFIRGVLWAVFDVERGTKHGGDYRPGVSPDLPAQVVFG